jgi:hypothetical protein
LTPDHVSRMIRASSLAELTWTDPDGAPDGKGVVALSWGQTPVVAFDYAHEVQARAAAAAPRVVLTLTEPRSTGTLFEPLAVTARPCLVEDLEGTIFGQELLAEELRRYPPARKFADSALLRREHWWYLPRLILALDVDRVQPLSARESLRDQVLVVAGEAGLHVEVVRLGRREPHGPLPLSSRGDDLPPPGRAALVGQDATFPDLEQWASWCFRGHWDGSAILLTQPAPTVGLPAVPSVWRRMRQQRAFGRACRAAIDRAERRR